MCLTVASAEAWGIHIPHPITFVSCPLATGIADIIMPHGRDQQGLTLCVTSLEDSAAPIPCACHLPGYQYGGHLSPMYLTPADLLEPRPPPRQ